MTVAPSTTLETIRRLLLGLLVLGLVGTTTELWFMSHYEDWWQLIPFAGMGISLHWNWSTKPEARGIQSVANAEVVCRILGSRCG